jgi:hypothetical protein
LELAPFDHRAKLCSAESSSYSSLDLPFDQRRMHGRSREAVV